MKKNTDKQKYDFDMAQIFTVRKVNIKRCNNCKDFIRYEKYDNKNKEHDYSSQYLWDKGYCSKWCYEIDNPPKIKNVCKFCDNVTAPIINSNSVTKGYRTICNSCISLGKGRLTQKIAQEIEKDKTLDIIYEKEII